jgi:prepilin-type N-terminal cleavage/methylation domain-containing protein
MLGPTVWPGEDERGFTLIELMVVVLIIGILIAIALPTYLGARSRAEDRAAQADLSTALTAAKVYYAANQKYTGFDKTTGGAEETSLQWANNLAAGSSKAGTRFQVYIDCAGAGVPGIEAACVDPNTLLIASYSLSGTTFCMGDNQGAGGGTFYGAVDPYLLPTGTTADCGTASSFP